MLTDEEHAWFVRRVEDHLKASAHLWNPMEGGDTIFIQVESDGELAFVDEEPDGDKQDGT